MKQGEIHPVPISPVLENTLQDMREKHPLPWHVERQSENIVLVAADNFAVVNGLTKKQARTILSNIEIEEEIDADLIPQF